MKRGYILVIVIVAVLLIFLIISNSTKKTTGTVTGNVPFWKKWFTKAIPTPTPLPEVGECGDSSVNGAEVCDGANLNGKTCQSLGYVGGTLSCKSDCMSFDTSKCISADTVFINTDNNQFIFVTFTSARAGTAGEKKLVWVYDNDTSSTAVQPILAHQTVSVTNRGHIHVKEGENAIQGDWIIINQGDTGTILEVDDISSSGTECKVTFRDAITDESLRITLTNTTNYYRRTGINFYGGNGYTISADGTCNNPTGATKVNITWSLGNITINPADIKLKYGNHIAFDTRVHARANGWNCGNYSDKYNTVLLAVGTKGSKICVPIIGIRTEEIAVGKPVFNVGVANCTISPDGYTQTCTDTYGTKTVFISKINENGELKITFGV